MLILGIETSCDETSAAIVEETADPSRPWSIRSNVIAAGHDSSRVGRRRPELASRQHVRDICGVVERALEEGRASWSDLGAVRRNPGTGSVGSLLVGVVCESAAAARGLPLVAVHHLAGHIESLVLQNGEIPLPAVVLVVSGVTRACISWNPWARIAAEPHAGRCGRGSLRQSRQAAWPGYPGGPIVDRLARTGNDRAINLPTTRLTHADRNAPQLKGDLDFSFSGLKTAVLRTPARPPLGEQELADICATFQRIVVTALIERTFSRAAVRRKSIGIAGGVSANSRLREELKRQATRARCQPSCPASAALHRQRRNDRRRWPQKIPGGYDVSPRSERRCCTHPLAPGTRHPAPFMITFTDYLFFNTKTRQEFVRITDDVAAIVKRSGVAEGMALVSAMHITAGVFVNDWEDGLIHDFQVWLEKLAPAGLNYRHHQTGEDNADAHLKRTIMGHQVMLPNTAGKLDLGPWEQVFYAEFDGQRKKRVVVKVMGA
jgi:secondary thiamine-phosphate synthase enzyme